MRDTGCTPRVPGLCRADGVLFCQLQKALHSCVQALKLWYEKLKKFLLGLGYVKYEVYHCVFKQLHGENVYLLLLYVDDILIMQKKE
jgi:hypothetical protein